MKKNILLFSILLSYNLTIAQFAPSVLVTEEGTPRDIVSGDFNQDGFIDFLYSSDINTPFIHVVLNDGTGNYLPPSFVISDIGQGHSVGVGDLNGDGILDIASQGITSGEFNWYAGNGDGTFSSANVINSSIGGLFISETIIFDLDANGHQDIVIIERYFVNSPFGFVGWFKNNGNGNIDTLAIILDDIDAPFNLDYGDLDGDIYPDVVVGKNEPQAIFIMEYDGAGGFSFENLNTSMEWATGVMIADLDMNGSNDIVATESDFAGMSYWVRLGNGDWSNELSFSAPNGIIGGLGYEDFDLNGKPDIVYSTLSGEVGYYPNNSTNFVNFGIPVILETGLNLSRNLVVVDSDNDNDNDILVASQITFGSMGANKISYFRNLSNDASMAGNVFWDENENGMLDANEILLPNFPIEVSPSSFAVFTNDDGGFRVFADAGTYELIPEFEDCWEVANGVNFTINFDGVNTVEDILIGVTQVSNAENVHVGMTSATTRCGFTVPFWMNYTNIGCQTISGKIQMVKSDLTDLISVETSPDQTINDTLIWNFDDLVSGENRQVSLAFEIADASFIGDTISIPLQFFKENTDGSFEQIDSSLFTSIINCAYDPNDKQTYPRRSEVAPYNMNYTLMDERIDYTIRFQNTGTDTAFNIVIRDTFSTDLDLNSFQPLSASHAYETVLHDDGRVEFFFRNILLVDSFANEPLSHGYVQFSIEANDNLPDATSIFNTAGIYFDFNEPIITNTVENLMVDMLPVFTDVDDFITTELQVFPNPVAIGNTLYLNNLPLGEKMISVYNTLGQLVFREKNGNDSFEILSKPWKGGIYFIVVESDKEKQVGKVLVK